MGNGRLGLGKRGLGKFGLFLVEKIGSQQFLVYSLNISVHIMPLDILLGGHQLPRALARGSRIPLLMGFSPSFIFNPGLKPN